MTMQVAINPQGPVNSSSSDLPFINPLRLCAQWFAGPVFKGQTPLTAAQMTPNGFPLVEAWAFVGDGNQTANFIQGLYYAQYDGSATMALYSGATPIASSNIATANGVTTFQANLSFVNNGQGSSVLAIHVSGSFATPMTQCSATPAKYHGRESQIWTDEYLANLAPFACIRTLDLVEVNNLPATPITWANRRTLANPFWSGSVPVEAIAKLMTLLPGKSVWLCIPDTADATWINGAVPMLLAALSAGGYLYAEHSNELWDNIPAYPQSARLIARAAVNPALTVNAGGDAIAQQMGFEAIARAQQVNTAAGALAGQVRNVACFQAYQPPLGAEGLAFAESHYGKGTVAKILWGIGYAPYLGDYIDQETAGMTEPQLVAMVSAQTDSVVQPMIAAWQMIAATYGIATCCYEFGLGVIGFVDSNPLSVNNAAKQAMQADPAYAAILTKAFGYLAAAGVALVNHLGHVVPDWINSQGWQAGWGVLQAWNEPVASSPKAASLWAAAAKYNAPAPARTLDSTTVDASGNVLWLYSDGSTATAVRP